MPQKARQILAEIYHRLAQAYGPQNWWPADSALEMMVGAVLTQNAAWQNVEKALAQLKKARLLSFKKLDQLSPEEISPHIRSAGYYNLKAKRLKSLLDFLREHSPSGSFKEFQSKETGELREAFLGVWGLGPETVDSILLYALDRPVFVIDAYTYRVFHRHHLIGEEASYGEMQELAMDHVKAEIQHYQEYHALLVQVGKDYCKPKPRCETCPLKGVHWE